MNNRQFHSAGTRKLFFSLMWLAVCLGVTHAQTPGRAVIQDVFFSSQSGRYLGQDGVESFPVTANILKNGTVVYTQGLGNVAFKQGHFSIELGTPNLSAAVLNQSDLILQLVLPSQTATFAIAAVPYAVRARVAERGLFGDASRVSGNFVATFSVQTGVVVSRNAFVVRGPRIGVGTFSPVYSLDVAGTANFSEMYMNGQPLRDALSWREGVNPQDIYTPRSPVGIGTAFPNLAFALHVGSTVNATALARNGNPITASNFWTKIDTPSASLSLIGYDVGIGKAVPQETLDVRGAIRMGTTSSGNTGSMRFASVGTGADFQGYVDMVEGSVPTKAWLSLTGIGGSGRPDRVAHWTGLAAKPRLGNATDLVHQAGVGLGFGVIPQARLQVVDKITDEKPPFLVSSATNTPLLHVSPTGGVTIGDIFSGNKLEVVGTVNARDFLINGVPLRLTLSRGTYWLRGQQNQISYLHGNVGIGRPDPTSLLEIAAPNRFNTEPTKNPAITFTSRAGSAQQQSYTMGINARQDGVFRVERGAVLGAETPLFVAFDDRFGIGLTNPRSNLHVSGNTGLILSGLYESSTTVSVTGPGTRLLYHPSQGIFRVGYLSTAAPYSGTQWDNENLGKVTTAFGRDHMVSGNFSHALGGEGHTVGGAYATVLGGQGNQVYGDFAVAMGRNAGARNHGTFVWTDSIVTENQFATVTENQFLIRAGGGVGINASDTSVLVNGENRGVALSIFPRPVGAVHFLSIVSDPSDWASAQLIVDALKTQGYLTSAGHLTSLFQPQTTLNFPTGFPYMGLEAQIRQRLATQQQEFVLDLMSFGQSNMVYTQQGGWGIGINTPAPNTIVMMAPMVVNTVDTSALLSVKGVTTEPLFLTVGTENPAVSPSFVVVASGNVGIGKFPDLLAAGREVVSTAAPAFGYLDSVSGIVADAFTFPDGQSLSPSAPVLVWSFINTPNIHFPSANAGVDGRLTRPGLVGIGTSSPNSLLTLSNRSSLQSLTGTPISPALTFDIAGQDKYTLGIFRNTPSVFQIVPGGTAALSGTSALLVSGNHVGIGASQPITNALLGVGGNALVSRLRIGNLAAGPTTSVRVATLDATKFLVNNTIIDWLSINRPDGSVNIFYDTNFDLNQIPPIYSYVGIGMTQPRYPIDVAGTVNVTVTNSALPAVVVRNLTIQGDYTAGQLNFRDSADVPSLKVVNKELVLDTQGTVINISKVFTRGEGAGGYMGMWVTDANVPTFAILARSNMYWTSPTSSETGQLLVTGNTSVASRFTNNAFVASNNINFGTPSLTSMLQTKSHISHAGDLANSRSHQAVSVNLRIRDWPDPTAWVGGTPSDRFDLRGVAVHLENLPYNGEKTFFSVNGTAIGLQSDVRGVNLQEFADLGYRFSGIFTGASELVGIGGAPRATLDVYGTVIAQFFRISNSLTITTINVQSAMFVDSPGRVGFGTHLPTNALDIIGGIQSVGLVAPVSAATLRAGSDFSVGENGYVGMGLSNPSAQWQLQRRFAKLPNTDFTFQVIENSVSGNAVAHPVFGYDIHMRTVTGSNYSNRLGDAAGVQRVAATGYKINLTGLDVPTSAVVSGLEVVVSANTDPERKTALFLGGNVGIGTTEPAYPLDVNGTIFATNAPAASFLTEQEVASFNAMSVAQNLRIGLDAFAKNVRVNTLSQKHLRILSMLKMPSENLNVANQLLVLNEVSVNTRVSTNTLAATGLATLYTVSTNRLTVGGNETADAALRVYTGVRTDMLDVSGDGLSTPVLSINTGRLQTSGRNLGIGTTTPFGAIHIQTSPYLLNTTVAQAEAVDYRTWNPMILQARVATVGHTVGIAFSPNLEDSEHVGSGIVAIRTSGTESASALGFVTDPDGLEDRPAERLRITESGNVGIGTVSPDALLTIAGTFRGDAGMQVPTLSVSTITGDTILVSTIDFKVRANIERFRTDVAKLLPIQALPNPTMNFGQLFLHPTNNNLYYAIHKDGENIFGNLSVTVSVATRTVPYFGQERALVGTELMQWTTANVGGAVRGVFSIASDNPVVYPVGSRVSVQGFVSQDRTNGTPLQQVKLVFRDRTTPSNANFSGMAVRFGGGTTFQEDRMIGLHVSVSENLRAQTTLSDGTQVSGKIVAAAFLSGDHTSGNVGIMPSQMTPSAALHVVSNQAPLWIQGKPGTATVDAVIVSKNAWVGIGTSLPTAKLSVVGPVVLTTSSGQGALYVTGGVGIRVAQPSVALEVGGDFRAPGTAFGGLRGTTLSVASQNQGVFVSTLGEVMLGTETPRGQLTLRRHFNSPIGMATTYVLQDITQSLGIPVTRNLTGLAMSLYTDSFSTFQGSDGTRLARGMVVDLRTLAVAGDTPVVGISTKMGLGGTRYAATLLGGNVGIGVSAPSVALYVSGDIRARNLQTTAGEWLLSSVTTNSLYGGTGRMVGVTIQNTGPISLEVGDILGVGSSATVDIQGVTDTQRFDAMNLFATVATLNRVVVTSDTGFLPGTVLGITGSGRIENLQVATVNITSSIFSTDNIWVTGPVLMSQTGAVPVSVTGSIRASYLGMAPSPTKDPSTYVGYTTLFVRQDASVTNQGLIFRNPTQGMIADVSNAVIGAPFQLAGYNASGRLSDQPHVRYTETTLGGIPYFSMRVGTSNMTVASGNGVLVFYTGYGQRTDIADARAMHVSVGMGPRAQASTDRFSGVGVRLIGQTSPLATGVSAGDVAGGVYVDMHSSLQTRTVLPNGTPVVGTKIAAIFRAGTQTSGNVGINTDESGAIFRPSANLHIVAATPNPIRVAVSGAVTRTAIGSDSKGFLSFGHVTPSAKLSVSATAQNQAVRILAGSTELIVAGDNGLAVGQTPNGAQWSVAGTARGTTGRLDGMTADRIAIGDRVVVTNQGYLGIGDTAPAFGLSIQTNIPLPEQLVTASRQRVLNLRMDSNAFDKSFVGQRLVVTADANSVLANTAHAVGASVKTPVMGMVAGAVKGVVVDMGAGANRNAFVALGGAVGIGVTAPGTTMDIAGTLTGRSIESPSVSVNGQAATANTVSINGPAFAGAMTIDSVGTGLTVLDTLRFAQSVGATVNFQDNLMAMNTWESEGVLASAATFHTLFIPYKPIDISPSLALWVSPDVRVRQTFSVFGSNGIAVASFVTANLRMPTLNFTAQSTNWRMRGQLGLNKGMYFPTVGSVLPDQGTASLVQQSDNSLHYAYTEGSLSRALSFDNLFVPYVGTPVTFNVPVYGQDSVLTKNIAVGGQLSWVGSGTSGTFNIRTVQATNSAFSLGLIASLNTTAQPNGYSANTTALLFADRNTPDTGTFVGTDIVLNGDLGVGDVVQGVRVDLRSVYSQSSTFLPVNEDSAVDGFKASAVFLAGNNGDTRGTVGIFTLASDTQVATPDATLHVRSTRTGLRPLDVSSIATTNTLIVVTHNMGIWTASQDAQLATSRLVVHATEESAFRVAPASGVPALAGRQNGSVGIGTTQPVASLNVVHQATTGYALWIDNPVTSNPLVMTGVGRMGFGETNPTTVLDMRYNTNRFNVPVPIVWKNTGVSGTGPYSYTFAGKYTVNGVEYDYLTFTTGLNYVSGTVFINGEAVTSTNVNLNVSDVALFESTTLHNLGYLPLEIRYMSGSVPTRAMTLGNMGRIGVGRPAPVQSYIAASVSGSVMVGSDTEWTAPAWLDTPESGGFPIGNGFVLRQPRSFAFMGHYRPSSSSGYDAAIWGKETLAFVFRDMNQAEALRFQATRVGVVNTDPKATLSIGATQSSQQPFQLTLPTSVFVVDTLGNSGFGTKVPSENLHVIGDATIRATNNNTLMVGTVTTNRLTTKTLAVGVNYAVPADFLGALPIQNLALTIDTHTTRNMSGLAYVANTGVARNQDNLQIEGLRVDVSTVETREFTTGQNGSKNAATFLGGPFVVGHRLVNAKPVIPTATIALQAYAMNADGQPVVTGNLLRLDVPTANNKITTIRVQYEGNQDVYHELTPWAFTNLRLVGGDTGLSDTESATILERLNAQPKGVTTRTASGARVPATDVNTSVFDSAEYATYLLNSAGYNDAQRLAVWDMLRQAKQKASFVLYAKHTDYLPSMIQILTGQNASAGNGAIASIGTGYVGIGVSSSNADLQKIDRPLVVSGDVRIGRIGSTVNPVAVGWGNRLYFSGGRAYPGQSNDGTREYFMGRYNRSATISELRLNIGETNVTSPNSRLIIDSEPTFTTFQESIARWGQPNYLATGFSVSVFGYVDPAQQKAVLAVDPDAQFTYQLRGGVGIGTTDPRAGLHIVNSNSEASGPVKAHTALVDGASTGNHLLAIRNNGSATDANFITFLHKDPTQAGVPTYAPKILGAIEHDGFGGVQFSSPEADYAEFLPKKNTAEIVRPGDVVGIFDGNVSRETAGARSIKVISSRPIVVGNWPGADQLGRFGLVAFMGQVPVRVMGPVNAGDYLVPSGRQDGTAVAVTPSDILSPRAIIGQAWESAGGNGEKLVNTFVGASFAHRAIAKKLEDSVRLRQEIASLAAETATLKTYLQAKYEERQAKIARLKQ